MPNENKFDYLIPEVSKILTHTFMQTLSVKPEFKEDVDTAPLLNMTIGTFISALINMMDTIKDSTEGEDKLLRNIELAKTSLIKAIADLPFVSNIVFM